MDKKRIVAMAAALVCGVAMATPYPHHGHLKAKVCEKCLGTGECHKCEGTGIRSGWFSDKLCTRCEGTGWCAECGGYGTWFEAPPRMRPERNPKLKHNRPLRHETHREPPPAPRPQPKPVVVQKPVPKPQPAVQPKPAAVQKPVPAPSRPAAVAKPHPGTGTTVRKPGRKDAPDKKKK